MASGFTCSMGSAPGGRKLMRSVARSTVADDGSAAISAPTLAASESTIWLGSLACAWARVRPAGHDEPQVTKAGTELARTLAKGLRSMNTDEARAPASNDWLRLTLRTLMEVAL